MAGVLDSIDPRLCVACKAARGLCGMDPCPLLQRVQDHLPKVQVTSRDLWGSSPPSLFVGRHGYPNVHIGPMLPPQHLPEAQARDLDAPATWLDRYSIPDVVGLRSGLIRTTHSVRVDRGALDPDRITRLSQELAVAARPVDTEVRLTKIPGFSTAHVADFTAPHGPVVGVERARLGENVRVERPVEKATSDTDLRAAEGIVEMYRDGVDPYQVERILSAGMLGQGRHRRLVPTRWAITATDDAIGKALIPRVLDLPTIDKPTVHFAERFGNRFHVLLLPRVWGFENVEAWCKGSFWASGRSPDASFPAGPAMPIGAAPHAKAAQGTDSTPITGRTDLVAAVDWEDHTGRTAYASNTTGGYYATRLPVLEQMLATGRQATAVVLREVTEAYTTPLGVWVVRETTRRAMQGRGLEFEDLPSAVRHITRRAIHKEWLRDAELLPRLMRQRTLDSWTHAG